MERASIVHYIPYINSNNNNNKNNKRLRFNTSKPSYHRQKRRLHPQCFVKVRLCLRFRRLSFSYIYWMIGCSLSIALKSTDRQPSRRAIDDESEGPSASEAVVKPSPSHGARLR